jgi:hypothetical protein
MTHQLFSGNKLAPPHARRFFSTSRTPTHFNPLLSFSAALPLASRRVGSTRLFHGLVLLASYTPPPSHSKLLDNPPAHNDN